MSAANVAVALAGLSLALSTAALVSVGALERRVRAQGARTPLVPRLDLARACAEEAGSRTEGEGGRWAEGVSECEDEEDGEWEDGEWEKGAPDDDDKENRPPPSDDPEWYHSPLD